MIVLGAILLVLGLIFGISILTYIGVVLLFFCNDTATTEIYTLSLHDALPIFDTVAHHAYGETSAERPWKRHSLSTDRKSTRLNSSHVAISYAVFCLQKKN